MDSRKSKERRVGRSKMEQYQESIARNEWDVDAWVGIISLLKETNIVDARDQYDKFFKQFPSAGRQWAQYAQQEYQAGNHKLVEKIFRDSLLVCLNVDLWKFYLEFVIATKKDTPDGLKMITHAYEFSLEHMGLDLNSTSIWMDYIQFLKDLPAETKEEEGVRMTSLRRTCQRAVQVPMHNVEAVWKEYEAFEMSLNKDLAVAFMKELTPKYNHARASYRERRSFMDGLLRTALACPPPPTEKVQKQALIWKRLIAFEKSNPQKLDQYVLHRRILFTYKQCLLCMRLYPDIWLDMINYLKDVAGIPMIQVKQTYQEAVKALPKSLLIGFSYCNWEEIRKNFKEVNALFEAMVQTNDDPLVYIQWMRAVRRMEGVDAARKIFLRARKSPVVCWQIFCAAAEIEFVQNKDPKAARNIFELGIKKYGNVTLFVLEYFKFLEHLNDTNNLRVAHRRIQEKLKLSLPMWREHLDFEYSCGDLPSIVRAEQKFKQLFPRSAESSDPIVACRRQRYKDLWPCSQEELESFHKTHYSEVTKAEKEEIKEQHAKETREGAVVEVGPKAFLLPPVTTEDSKTSESDIIKPQYQFLSKYEQGDSRTGNLIMHGVSTSIPPAVIEFALRLPPPSVFAGVPPPNVDNLIEMISQVDTRVSLPTTTTVSQPPLSVPPPPTHTFQHQRFPDSTSQFSDPMMPSSMPPDIKMDGLLERTGLKRGFDQVSGRQDDLYPSKSQAAPRVDIFTQRQRNRLQSRR